MFFRDKKICWLLAIHPDTLGCSLKSPSWSDRSFSGVLVWLSWLIKSQNVYACMPKVKPVASIPYKCQVLLLEAEKQQQILELANPNLLSVLDRWKFGRKCILFQHAYFLHTFLEVHFYIYGIIQLAHETLLRIHKRENWPHPHSLNMLIKMQKCYASLCFILLVLFW